MRPIFVDFPNDPKAEDVEDAFLFGPDILVAPIAEAGARGRRVYLPEGQEWENAWSGKCFAGGKTLEVPAPLETIPVFIRSGAAVGKCFREI